MPKGNAPTTSERSTILLPAKDATYIRDLTLPWIFLGSPLKINGAPRNIQGNLTPLNQPHSDGLMQKRCNSIADTSLNYVPFALSNRYHQLTSIGWDARMRLWCVIINLWMPRGKSFITNASEEFVMFQHEGWLEMMWTGGVSKMSMSSQI